jgi:uncharacterized protein YbcC (UPF0753/DUF2309 family)
MTESSALQQQIEEAVEPVSQFWPMRTFVHHNPIHGLEHLPFDDAIREAKHLFGAEGYLPNDEYRGFYQSGRITEQSVDRAFAHIGPKADGKVSLGSRAVTAAEVQLIHFLHGVNALEPALFNWQVSSEGALSRHRPGADADVDLEALWQHVLSVLDLVDPRFARSDKVSEKVANLHPELPFRRALSDWLDELTDSSIVATIDEHMIKWVSSFVDEGMAGWEMPGKRSGFYAGWRELAAYDASGRFLGIKDFAGKLAALPEDPEAAITQSLDILQIPEARRTDYLTRVLAQLAGWTGYVRWRGLNPNDLTQRDCPIDIVHYLAARLFYERELVGVEARRQWGVDGTLPAITKYLEDRGDTDIASVSPNKLAVCRDAWRVFNLAQLLALPPDAVKAITRENVAELLSWLDAFPEDLHGPVWLEAYEESYRKATLSKILANKDQVKEGGERPLAQVAFCIDVRSEPFRRNFEKVGNFETFGYAGFFGIPISHRNYDTDESPALCPVLLSPSNALYELPRDGQDQELADYASGSRWKRFGDHLFHDLKHNPIASFLLVDVLGVFFSLGLVGKTMIRRPWDALMRATDRWFVKPVVTEIDPGVDTGEPPKVIGEPTELVRGFTVEEQANFVEGGLRTVGLVKNFGRFIVLCGHGSTSDNNPYFAALDCGACGGQPGDPNARTFAAMGNSPAVREELARRGLDIPEDTWFLPAKHNTNTDRIDLYDLIDVPDSHREDLQSLRDGFAEGGANQALERTGRIPGTPRNMSVSQAFAHVESRSYDWANTRPEWGLSGNAAFIIARRTVTKGVDLGGRTFLHSYDSRTDPEGAILEKIMTAPLVVGEWINMEHYFSATDPWKYGSGSKVIHNVVAGIGLMYGAQSDLATGLPLQTVNNGQIHKHEPMRLLTIIEADPEIIGGIIGRHGVLQQFFHNEWVNLVALDPATYTFHRYYKDATWRPVEL